MASKMQDTLSLHRKHADADKQLTGLRLGSDFGSITGQQLQELEDEINDRPRNVLGYRHPNDYLGDLLA